MAVATATVREWMTSPALTVTPSWSIRRAYDCMTEAHIRHLPVVERDRLVGILTLSDIRDARPSDATTLSIWELNYLWDQLTVEKVMTQSVITTTPETLVIDAVKTMLEHKFSGLPVVDEHHRVVGFLSQIDIYRMLVAEAERELAARP